jgi:Polyketide cyclase / dehydrase and lipid transport
MMTGATARGTRVCWNDDMAVEARPETVFPLLCPVREFEWIPDWKCEMIHSRSGVAEDGCVFQTAFAPDGRMTWVVSRYEPPCCIEFSCLVPDLFVMRLKVRLEPAGAERTSIHWVREFLSLGEAGDRHLAEHKTETQRRELHDRLERLLREHLARQV